METRKSLKVTNSRSLSLALLLAFGICLACGDHSDLRLRYDCERLYYFASRNLQQQRLLGDDGDPNASVQIIESFKRVVDRFWERAPVAESSQVSQPYKQAWYLAGKAHLRIGELYYRNNHYLEAEREFREVAESYPLNRYESALALYYAGSIAELRGDYEKSLSDYEKIMKGYELTREDGRSPDPLLIGVPVFRAEVFQKKGEAESFRTALEDARCYYRDLYDTDPESPLAAAALGKIASTYLLEARPQKAIELLSRLKDDRGNLPAPVMLRIAQIYLEHAEDYRNAEITFSRYLSLYPGSEEAASAQLGLGLSLFYRHEYDSASRELLKVEKNYPEMWEQIPKAHFLYALCFEKRGDWQRAFTELNWVKVNFPASPEGLEVPFYIAQYYHKSGEESLARDSFQKGIDFYRKIVDTYSKTAVAPIAQSYIARCLLALGSWRQAAESFETLAELFPNSKLASTSLLAAADIYKLKLNDRASAANSLREYLERFPYNPEADKLRKEIESLEA